MSPRIFLSKQAQNTTAMQKVQQKCSLKFAKCIVLEISLPYFSSDINVKLNLWSNFVDFFLSNLMRTFLKNVRQVWGNPSEDCKKGKLCKWKRSYIENVGTRIQLLNSLCVGGLGVGWKREGGLGKEKRGRGLTWTDETVASPLHQTDPTGHAYHYIWPVHLI